MRKCLILNSDSTIFTTVNWQRALTLVFKDVVEPVDYYSAKVKDCSGNFYPIPAVLRLKKYIRVSRTQITISKRKLIARDKNTCAYCGKHFPSDSLSIDHIKPTSRFPKNPNNWKNVITACFKCNRKKGNKTPDEAGMPLKFQPTIPSHFTLTWNLDKIPKEWKIYLAKKS